MKPTTTATEPTTIKGWLETLPEPARSQAIANAEKEYSDITLKIDEIEAPSLNIAVMSAFNWKTTPQGSQYWYDLLKAATA